MLPRKIHLLAMRLKILSLLTINYIKSVLVVRKQRFQRIKHLFKTLSLVELYVTLDNAKGPNTHQARKTYDFSVWVGTITKRKTQCRTIGTTSRFRVVSHFLSGNFNVI